ncbi:MAG: TolB-like translocation protein [Acidobacteriota bacterium]
MTFPLTARRLFVLFSLAAVAAVVAYVALVPSGPAPATDSTPAAAVVDLITAVPDGPLILFRDGSPGTFFGRLAIVRLPLTDTTRLIAPLSCERVHYASGWGVCLITDESRLPVRHRADVFDASFAVRHSFPLTGPPIRARVAPDGRRAVLTVFETGHSYADSSFSTRTVLIETASGRRIADLEEFAVEKDGRTIKSADFNFWGITFARDGDQFFATLKTGGLSHLVHGSIDARRVSVLRTGVECPSLSPDGTTLVYKKPLVGEIGWRLHALDLAAGTERPLNQVRRSVDDQVEWFDDTHIVYHDSASQGTGVWVLSVDGVSEPRLLLPQAYSPAVQR